MRLLPVRDHSLPRACAVGLLLLVVGALLLRSARLDSVNYDETEYLYSGYRTWCTGDLSINPHPPLVKLLAGLGVLGVRPELDPDPDPGQVRTAWPQARRFLQRPAAETQRVLLAARLPMLLLWALLGVLVYAWSTTLYGPVAGFFSLGLFLLCPNLAAQGRLVSTDLGLCVFGTAALFAFWLAHRRPGALRWLLAGATLGLALGSRHQALVLAAALVPLYWWLGRGQTDPALLRRRRLAVLLPVAAAVVLLLLYGVVKIHYYAQGFRFLAETFDADSTDGKEHQPYLLGGELSDRGWFRYFPVLLLQKLPPLHLLLVLLVLAGLVWRRPRPEEWVLLLPAALIFGLAVASRINYGIRHVLIVLPLMWVLAGRLIEPARGRPALVLLLGATLAGGLVEMVRIDPHYLAYVSPLAGGPRSAYRTMADSNLDAGQALGHLARRIEQQGYGEVYLCYFGTTDPAAQGIRYRYLPGYWTGEQQARENARAPFPRYLAVSASFLHVYRRGAYRWLLQYEPVDHGGHAIQIYDRRPHPEMLAYLAGVYAEAGQVHRAVAHLRELSHTASAAIDRAWPWQLERLRQHPRAANDYGVALHQAGFDDQARALFERLAGEPGEAGRMARNNLRVVRRAQARRAFAADPELARRHGTLERYLEHLGLR